MVATSVEVASSLPLGSTGLAGTASKGMLLRLGRSGVCVDGGMYAMSLDTSSAGERRFGMVSVSVDADRAAAAAAAGTFCGTMAMVSLLCAIPVVCSASI